MVITEEQFRRIEHCLPTQRGNVKISNLDVLNAILYIAENGCKWRSLPKRFGRWHTVYTRLRRWAEAGVLDRVFTALQEEEIIQIRVEALSLDSTIVQVHPDGTGAEKKTARSPSDVPEAGGAPRFIWLPRMIGAQ
jgi:transposase